jgi:hypothetical protein
LYRELEHFPGYLSVDMQSSTLSSRIRESAAGLAKDLFPNSINGYGALETTNELATLRSTHKLSSAPSHGTSSAPQLSQVLRKRHCPESKSLQCPTLYSGIDTASDDDEELSSFLLQECNMGDSYASDPQSGSALDLVLVNEYNTERESREHLRRNDSFEPELSRSKQKSPAQSWHVDTEKLQQTSTLESFSREAAPEWSIPMTREDRHQGLSLGYHTKPIAESNAPDTASARRKERALSRLHLIFSQMPAVKPSSNAAALRQTDSLESSYNQICGGEDAQEWAEFEASLFRTYNGQSQAIRQDLQQTQQHEQTTTIIPGRQAPLEVNLHETHILQNLRPSREILLQQDQTLKKDDEQSKSKEPMIEFHCPWIDCHSVRVFPLEAVRDCSLTKCTEI